MKIHVVVNSPAGAVLDWDSGPLKAEILAAFWARGHEETLHLISPDALLPTIQRALDQGCQALVVDGLALSRFSFPPQKVYPMFKEPTTPSSPADHRAKRVCEQSWRERWPVEAEVLLALGGAAAGVLAFLLIAGSVFNGGFRGIDEALLLALRNPVDRSDPLGPAWFEEVVRDLTALGSTAVLTLVVLAVWGFLTLSGRPRKALAVLVWSAAGALFSTITKLGFARPRPDLVPHGAEVYTHSFPSGHALSSAVIYLTLGAMIALVQDDRRIKFYVLAFAVLVTILVGMSRVYLGVHWPSDVLAGWALGAAWATIGWLVFRRIDRGALGARQ